MNQSERKPLDAKERCQWIREFRRASWELGRHPHPIEGDVEETEAHKVALALYQVTFNRLLNGKVWNITQLLNYANEQVKNVRGVQS